MSSSYSKESAVFVFLGDVTGAEIIKDKINSYLIKVITSNNEELTRIRVVGTVTQKYFTPAKEGKKAYTMLTLDDGTGTILAKGWQETAELMNSFNIGDQLDVIGRFGLNEDSNELFIIIDNIFQINDVNKEIYLRTVRAKRYLKKGFSVHLPSKKTEADSLDKNETRDISEMIDRVLTIIQDSDKEVSVDEIINITKLDEATIVDILQTLYNRGEIYETKANTFKKA